MSSLPFARPARTRSVVVGGLLATLFATGCARSAAVQSSLPLRRVVVYRNGVGYFERQGHVADAEVRFRVTQREVDDFLATLAVMEQGGSSVRSAAFPLPEEHPASDPAPADARRTVRLSLDGREHDLLVGYTVETPIWRPSYRLIFNGAATQVQAWGIVQNVSGEDWSGVRLSLVAGAPVSFRSELSRPTVPLRPTVTDQGAVIDAVPQSDTTLAADAPTPPPAPPPQPPAEPEPSTGLGVDGTGEGGGGNGEGTIGLGSIGAIGHGAAQGYGSGAGRGLRSRDRTTNARMQSQLAPTPRERPAPSAAPRNVSALAALAVQGGVTRYDLPDAVTIPDRSATMVMLAARDVPGAQMYLFAPDAGVPDSASHPFHVARFENRTGALLERGPVAIFEAGAFLGQGLLDALPDGATTTVPFALERALAVDHSETSAVEGARLVTMVRGELTIERFNVTRTTYRVRNGVDRASRVLLRHPLNDAQLFEPPAGTEQTNGNALVPIEVGPRGHAESVVTTRRAFSDTVELADEQAAAAIEAYLRDGHPAAEVAAALRTALDLRRQLDALTRERAEVEQRRDDLQAGVAESRANLLAIQRNAQAGDLRAQLTARLGRAATQLDQLTRRMVELDTQMGERRVRLVETVRAIDVDVSRSTTAPAAATPATP